MFLGLPGLGLTHAYLFGGTTGTAPAIENYLLVEDNSPLLLEDGSEILLES